MSNIWAQIGMIVIVVLGTSDPTINCPKVIVLLIVGLAKEEQCESDLPTTFMPTKITINIQVYLLYHESMVA